MVNKFGFFDELSDQLFELGKSTAKQTGQAVKQIVDPKKIVETVIGIDKSQDTGMEQLEKGQSKKQNHTKLDFSKLQQKYKDQDAQKTNALRIRLFQLVKGEEEKTVLKMRQDELGRKREEEYEAQEKKKREEEKKRFYEEQTQPKGKIRKSIFSAKKMAKREQAEVKPASGKQ